MPTLTCAAAGAGGAKVCTPCGTPGASCCGGAGGSCFGDDLDCNKDAVCAPCGGVGQPCCTGAGGSAYGCRSHWDGFRALSTVCTAPYFSDDPVGTCQLCGAPGQLCCGSQVGNGYTMGACGEGFICSTPSPDDDPKKSVCTACGLEGQPCCGAYRDQCSGSTSAFTVECDEADFQRRTTICKRYPRSGARARALAGRAANATSRAAE